MVPRAQREELIDRFPSLVSYDIGGGRFKLAAGWLIEACGLKGAVRGRAGVYPRQALVLVNLGGATGAEILALAREVQDGCPGALRHRTRTRTERRLTKKAGPRSADPCLRGACSRLSAPAGELGSGTEEPGRAPAQKTRCTIGSRSPGPAFIHSRRSSLIRSAYLPPLSSASCGNAEPLPADSRPMRVYAISLSRVSVMSRLRIVSWPMRSAGENTDSPFSIVSRSGL